MALMRSLLLAASQNAWLRNNAEKFLFVRRSVSRFMPGETLDSALTAGQTLLKRNIGTVFTHLGENVTDRAEAESVAEHYLEVLDGIHRANLPAEVSVKLTQLGLDLSPDFCFENLERILQREKSSSTVWLDMEASNYVDATLGIYKRALKNHPSVGICLQSYLYRTRKDLANLLSLRPSIRLVKGAYNEPSTVAFPKKTEVDESYFTLAQEMVRAHAAGACPRAAFGTHDLPLIRRIADFVFQLGLPKSELEVQMLYGIQRAEQERLAQQGCRSIVLVAYGTYWYPWFVRRLAERPANVWFLLRNVFAS
jgi:proline dehydrogenase